MFGAEDFRAWLNKYALWDMYTYDEKGVKETKPVEIVTNGEHLLEAVRHGGLYTSGLGWLRRWQKEEFILRAHKYLEKKLPDRQVYLFVTGWGRWKRLELSSSGRIKAPTQEEKEDAPASAA